MENLEIRNNYPKKGAFVSSVLKTNFRQVCGWRLESKDQKCREKRRGHRPFIELPFIEFIVWLPPYGFECSSHDYSSYSSCVSSTVRRAPSTAFIEYLRLHRALTELNRQPQTSLVVSKRRESGLKKFK